MDNNKVDNNKQILFFISDDYFFLQGIIFWHEAKPGRVIHTHHFTEDSINSKKQTEKGREIINAIPKNASIIICFNNLKLSLFWIRIVHSVGHHFVNVVDLGPQRVRSGAFSFLFINKKLNFNEFDERITLPYKKPTYFNYIDTFKITDKFLSGMSIHKISEIFNIPIKTIYNRLRSLYIALDIIELNQLSKMKLIQLCSEYDATHPLYKGNTDVSKKRIEPFDEDMFIEIMSFSNSVKDPLL